MRRDEYEGVTMLDAVGPDAPLVRVVFAPPFYNDVPASTEVCFDFTVSGSFPADTPPRLLDLRAEVVERSLTVLQSVDIFVPSPW